MTDLPEHIPSDHQPVERDQPGSRAPESLKRIERAVARLSAMEREVLLAHRIDSLSYQEIAAVTGLPVADVQQAIATALAAIDREICC